MVQYTYGQFPNKFAFSTDTASTSWRSFCDSENSTDELIISCPENIEADLIQKFIHFREHVEANIKNCRISFWSCFDRKTCRMFILMLTLLFASVYGHQRQNVLGNMTRDKLSACFQQLSQIWSFHRHTYEDVINDFANMKNRVFVWTIELSFYFCFIIVRVNCFFLSILKFTVLFLYAGLLLLKFCISKSSFTSIHSIELRDRRQT